MTGAPRDASGRKRRARSDGASRPGGAWRSRRSRAATSWRWPPRACGVGEGVADDALAHAAVAVVPITSGEGVIPGFVECVAAICSRLGCRARASDQRDRRRRLRRGAHRRRRPALCRRRPQVPGLPRWPAARWPTTTPCTAHAYVAALDAAAGEDGVAGRGGVAGKTVLVIGLGPVGRAATARLVSLGAEVLVCERDEARLAAVAGALPGRRPSPLAAGLARCRLVLDADADARPHRRRLGGRQRHCLLARPAARRDGRGRPGAGRAARLHEPLALGVAAMAVQALTAPTRSVG